MLRGLGKVARIERTGMGWERTGQKFCVLVDFREAPPFATPFPMPCSQWLSTFFGLEQNSSECEVF